MTLLCTSQAHVCWFGTGKHGSPVSISILSFIENEAPRFNPRHRKQRKGSNSIAFPYTLFTLKYLLRYETGQLGTRSLGGPHFLPNSGLAASQWHLHEAQRLGRGFFEVKQMQFPHVPCLSAVLIHVLYPYSHHQRWGYPLGQHNGQHSGSGGGTKQCLGHFIISGTQYHDWLCRSYCHRIIVQTSSSLPFCSVACVTLGKSFRLPYPIPFARYKALNYCWSWIFFVLYCLI